MGDETVDVVDGDGEADAGVGAGGAVDGGVDADDAAGAIEERAAGVAGVDSGVGLDDAADGAAGDEFDLAAKTKNNTNDKNLVESKGVADRVDALADEEVFR